GSERDGAPIALRRVAWRPALKRNRFVCNLRIWREACVQRREIDDWLEGGTRLALRLRRTVELALHIGSPPDQSEYSAIRTKRHKRALTDIALYAHFGHGVAHGFFR